MKAFSAIKSVVRQLRYLELTPAVGSRLQIQSLDSIEYDVRNALEEKGINCIGQLQTEEDTNYGCLKKYRLLDLKFGVSPPLPETNPIDVHFLKEVGFLPDTEDLKDGPILPGCDDAGLLSELIDDIDKDEWCIKVFLEDAELKRAIENHRVGELSKTFDQSAYFPHELTIIDACLTNCGAVWLFKHFYL